MLSDESIYNLARNHVLMTETVSPLAAERVVLRPGSNGCSRCFDDSLGRRRSIMRAQMPVLVLAYSTNKGLDRRFAFSFTQYTRFVERE